MWAIYLKQKGGKILINCEICGVSDADKKIRKIKGKYLCSKHITQLYRHGTFLEKTIYDGNEYIVHNDYVEIILRGKDLEETGRAIIDLEDFEKVKEYKWHIKRSRNTNYAVTSVGNYKIFLHRLVLNYYGENDIDHINNDGLNNRKENLRIVSHSTNLRNQHNLRKGIKKVPSGNYQAIITKDGKGIYLGTFPDYEKALAARLEAENKI